MLFRSLDSFLEAGHSIGVSEIARAVNLPKSTTYRIIRQLASCGYLERVGDSYRLGFRLFVLGRRFILSGPDGLLDAAAPFLGSLFLQTGFSVHLGVIEHGEVTILDRLQSHKMNIPFGSVAASLPATTTSIGKVLLALGDERQLRETLDRGMPRRTPASIQAPGILMQQLVAARSSGVAYDLEESARGVVSVASAIHWRGRAIAAVSAAGPAGRFDPHAASQYVLRTAKSIEADFLKRRLMAQDFTR